ncbi:MAG: TerC family protein [Bacteroidales bacterium]|nr:TerC family protein [Bacteroidales bacterium]
MNLNELLFFGGFLLIVVIMLVLDLGVFHKKDHVISFKEASVWTFVWISLALIFAVVIYFCAEWIHGITTMEQLQAINVQHGHNLALDSALGFEANMEMYRKTLTLEYLTGYLLEKALSIDNIFVMIMIFISFGIEEKYYHRVLFWGIIGAIVLRFIFIFASAALIQQFSWILAIFGAILVISGIKMFFEKNDEKIDTEKHPMVKFASKHFRLLPQGHGHDFFVRMDGKRYITPLFVVLLVIEFSDVIFAVDSIPAVFSVTQDPFIVFFSNIFAILGLRSLFFMLSNVMNMFWTLKYGLGVLLTFIGVKMLLHTFWHIEIGTGMSLLIIAGILVLSILLSIIFPKKEKVEAAK